MGVKLKDRGRAVCITDLSARVIHTPDTINSQQ